MTLTDALVAGSLGFAQDRLQALETAALGDVAAFAHAAGVDGFVDDGTVAAHLTTARSELAQVAPALAVPDFTAAAGHVAAALKAIDDAAKAVPGGRTLREIAIANAGFAGVAPKGLAQQLGLPAAPAGLQLADGSIVYSLTAPARSLAPAPLALGFAAATLTARLRLDGRPPAFSILLALTGIEAGVGGGPIAACSAAPPGRCRPTSSFGGSTPTHGLTLWPAGPARASCCRRGRRSARSTCARSRSRCPPGIPDTIDVGSTITVELGGVDHGHGRRRRGLHVRIDPAPAIARQQPARRSSLKAPTGIGLVLDTGLVRGGGFLGVARRRLRRRAAAAAGAGRGQGGRAAHARAELRARRRDVDRVPAADRPDASGSR